MLTLKLTNAHTQWVYQKPQFRLSNIKNSNTYNYFLGQMGQIDQSK